MSPIYVPGKVVLQKQFAWNESVWNPSMIQTALWLDAADNATLFTTDIGSTLATNGSTVGRWNDKSGNNRNARQANAAYRPTLSTNAQNTRNGITFSGNLVSLDFATAPLLNSTSGSAVYVAKTSVSNTTINNGAVLGKWGSAAQPNSHEPYDGAIYHDFLSTTRQNASVSFDLQTGFIARISSAANSWKYFLNGSSLISSNSNTVSVGSSPTIGQGVNTAGFRGNVFEIVVFNSVLSDAGFQKVEGYLAHKWGLTANLPAGHPYKTVGPTP
jgi:hypothetical protein